MANSSKIIEERQDQWGAEQARDPKWQSYLTSLRDNLFLGHLNPDTETEFRTGDGSELRDARTRPAKMRALISSSALVVNFFDSWRFADKAALARVFGIESAISRLSFEFKTDGYPVGPRSPNLDLMLYLADGQRVAVESKFAEPYRSSEGFGALSARYFPSGECLWSQARLPAAQRIADRLRPEWIHLDVPQLLKHLLGLASDPSKPATLVYLWFDTGSADANAHRKEVERFKGEVAGDSVVIRSATYQEIFKGISESEEPVVGWHSYMSRRYFAESP
ncbi:MAG: hypothetical protein HY847_12385 [Betaproteobacteria bacterium]|nr:hypothetical protein [Betaproteobacteria bacterium]